MGLESGVQSFDNNKQLEWMKRGHSAGQSVKAIEKVKKSCPEVNLGIHRYLAGPVKQKRILFGQPFYETF